MFRYISEFRPQAALSETPNFKQWGSEENTADYGRQNDLCDTEFIHDAMSSWAVSKAVCITMTYCFLPDPLGTAVVFCPC